jgi:predicted transcriptional regulator
MTSSPPSRRSLALRELEKKEKARRRKIVSGRIHRWELLA